MQNGPVAYQAKEKLFLGIARYLDEMRRQLIYFRPGEESRMLSRVQFGGFENGEFGATITYPIAGMPWRRNVIKHFTFDIGKATSSMLFSEVQRIRRGHPYECLDVDELWSDPSERANGITRDRQHGILCHSISISGPDGSVEEQYSMRETSEALLTSGLYRVFTDMVAPYERP